MALAQETRLQQQNLQMEPGIERPQSALSRGVQITEFKDARVNPEPVVLEETDVLLEQFLSPRKLMMLTGVNNLDDIRQLEMKVNTSDTSLGNFGQFLPNLKELKVSNSKIPRIRDLGSSLRTLNVVWASRCGLLELDGISSMCTLRELYLSYNEISDISPVGMLDQLEILDLEGNNLDDIVQIQYLTICSKLSNLTLEGNPLCTVPAPGEESLEYDYRQAVKKVIPHLQTLDDEILIEGVGSFQKHNVFDADWAYLEELQKDISLHDDSDYSDTSRPPSGQRPSTAALKPNTGYRPGSAMRPSSGFRPASAASTRPPPSARPGTVIGMRPDSASGRPASGDAGESPVTDGSDLTLGKVICGNPSKALLSRRRLNPDAFGELDTQAPEIIFESKIKTEHTFDILPEEEMGRSEIVDELKAWKEDHEEKMRIKKENQEAPQILRVLHDEADDAVSMSGDSEVDSDDEELSAFRDTDNEHIRKVHAENESNEEDQNCKILPSVSSFVPVSPSPSDGVESLCRNTDSILLSPHRNNNHKLSSVTKTKEQDSDTLIRAGSDNSFRISHLANRHKEAIPPPSQRDVVRKHIDASSQVQAQNTPLGSLYAPLPMSRTDSRGSGSIKINSTGLPRPPTSGPGSAGLGRLRREDDGQLSSPVIKSNIYDRSILSSPTSQRPITARAALGIPATPPKMRRTLPSVQSLPSKPSPAPK